MEMEEEDARYRVYVGVDVAAETFTAAWLVLGGKSTTPFTHRLMTSFTYASPTGGREWQA